MKADPREIGRGSVSTYIPGTVRRQSGNEIPGHRQASEWERNFNENLAGFAFFFDFCTYDTARAGDTCGLRLSEGAPRLFLSSIILDMPRHEHDDKGNVHQI